MADVADLYSMSFPRDGGLALLRYLTVTMHVRIVRIR